MTGQDRTDRQTGQRSDSKGRTVLQTVAQKLLNVLIARVLVVDHGLAAVDSLFSLRLDSRLRGEFKILKPQCSVNCTARSFTCRRLNCWNYRCGVLSGLEDPIVVPEADTWGVVLVP